MENLFSNIVIEYKNYPTVILGEDNFTGWFGKGTFSSEQERAKGYQETLEASYRLGVRGYSMSPHLSLLKVLRNFRRTHPDIICIANPHWQLNYYLQGKSLWTSENILRLNTTVASKLDRSVKIDNYWLNDIDEKLAFSNSEIESIQFDVSEYLKTMELFQAFCDFYIVSNIANSALTLIGRMDIVKREIDIIRKKGKIPIGMCQGGGPALKAYQQLNVRGAWLWINAHTAFPNLQNVVQTLDESKIQITAFRIFDHPNGFNFESSMEFIRKRKKITSIVVGVENRNQAEETFSNLASLYYHGG